MKRNLLAIAIPALLIAGSANASIEIWNQDGNKVNLDGRVKAMNYITKKGNDKGDHSEATIGFTGETQITDSLTGYARGNWQSSSAHDNSMGNWKIETRYAFAGLNFGNVGSLDYGRNDGLIKDVSSYTDVLPEYGGDTSSQPEYYILANRQSAVATYRNSNFFGLVDGLAFGLQYADRLNPLDDNGNVVADKTKYTREAYAVSADYAILDSGVSVATAYAQTAGKNNKRTWGAGLKYDANDLLVAATFFQAKDKTGLDETPNADAKKYWGFEVVAQYGIDFEVGRLTPSLAYIQHKQKDQDHGDIVKYVDVGATYQFNQNISAVVDYKINLLKEKDLGVTKKIGAGADAKALTKNTLGVGLVYQF